MATNAAVPVFDPVQLQRQTRGIATLQVEMLSLFVAEVERLMRQVEDAADPQVRADRLRALAGTARSMGASLLAHEARALETQIADETPDLAPLKGAVDATLSYVRRTAL
jgi:HPt (histidine-containing phosphotransfer) domain-containing protein